MSALRRILGLIIILTALVGVALSAGCAIYGRQVIDDVGAQTLATIELTRDNLETTTATLELAQSTVSEVNLTLETVTESALILSNTVSETNPLLTEINDITTDRLPEALGAVEQTLPNIAEVAGTVDNTLTALSNFGFQQNFFGLGIIDFDLGIDYNPEVRFDDSIRTLEESLDGLPGQLRTLEPYLVSAQANLNLISTNIDDLSKDIGAIEESLVDLPPLLGEYITNFSRIDVQLKLLEETVDTRLIQVRQALLFASIWFALVQIAPLYFGLQLLTAAGENREEEIDIEESEPLVDLSPSYSGKDDDSPLNS